MKLTRDKYHLAVKRWMTVHDRLPLHERIEDAYEGDEFGYYEQLVMNRMLRFEDVPSCYVTPLLRKKASKLS